MKTDYLQCNPAFHRHPYYNCVIIHRGNHNFFTWLLFLFIYSFRGTVLPFALIQPFSEVHYQWKKDHDLQWHRLWPQTTTSFIPARSICCGVFLVPAFDSSDEYLVVDVVDTNMFLHIKAMYPPVWVWYREREVKMAAWEERASCLSIRAIWPTPILLSMTLCMSRLALCSSYLVWPHLHVCLKVAPDPLPPLFTWWTTLVAHHLCLSLPQTTPSSSLRTTTIQ